MMRRPWAVAGLLGATWFVVPGCWAAAPVAAPDPTPLGIAIEAWPYPAPVRFLDLVLDGQRCRMAYMDLQPTAPANGRVAVLLHGKNFSSDYWADVMAHLAGRGYRVVVPDQVGFNKSSKPDLAYSFDMLAANTLALLDHLGIAGAVDLVGHSTGGMLAVRFARLHPGRVRRLVLEDPIGLEDYGRVIPRRPPRPWRRRNVGRRRTAIAPSSPATS